MFQKHCFDCVLILDLIFYFLFWFLNIQILFLCYLSICFVFVAHWIVVVTWNVQYKYICFSLPFLKQLQIKIKGQCRLTAVPSALQIYQTCINISASTTTTSTAACTTASDFFSCVPSESKLLTETDCYLPENPPSLSWAFLLQCLHCHFFPQILLLLPLLLCFHYYYYNSIHF